MRINATKFKMAVEEAGFEPSSYSGRCMYGKSCIGVTCDNVVEVAVKVLAELVMNRAGATDEDEIRDLAEEIGKARWDSMGRSFIVYWPGVEWVNEDDDDA